MGAGNYFLQFVGTGGTGAGFGGTLATSLNAVPLPGALPLFATGLIGLWALRRKRKGQPAAV